MLGVSVNGYCFSFSSSKHQVRAMSSGNWVEVTSGKGLASKVSKLETIAYPALFFHPRQSCFHWCTRFPQDSSQDLLTIPLGVLSSGPRFLDKSERGELSGVCRRVAGFKNLTKGSSQASQHYLISEDPLVRHQ